MAIRDNNSKTNYPFLFSMADKHLMRNDLNVPCDQEYFQADYPAYLNEIVHLDTQFRLEVI